MSQLWKRYLMGMLSGVGSIGVKTVLGLLVIPLMVARLGVEAFGLYILLIGVLEVATLLDMGVTPALARLLSGDSFSEPETRPNTAAHAHETAYLKEGHSIFIVLSLILLMIGFLLVPAFTHLFNVPAGLAQQAPLLVGMIVLEGALTLYSSYYRAILLSQCLHQWTNASDTAYHVLVSLGALVLLTMGLDLTAILMVRLGAAALRLGLLMAHACRVEPRSIVSGAAFQWARLKEIAGLSGHSMAINVSIIISHKIDVFVIGSFLSLSAVGVYEIVFRFLGVIIQVCSKLCEGTYPLFSGMAGSSREASARALFLRMSCFMSFVGGLLLLIMTAFYPEVFAMFTANRIPIEPTWPLLWMAVPIIWSGVVQMPATAYLFSSGQQQYLTVSSVLAALANLVLSVILVQWLGIAGVALGTLIPQLVQHQASLIRHTCKTLSIGFSEYFNTVHGQNLLPLACVALLILAGRTWMPIHAGWAIPSILLVFTVTGLSGFALWFWRTASDYERSVLEKVLLRPLGFTTHHLEHTNG